MGTDRSSLGLTHTQTRYGDNMIEVGDLVKREGTGEIGIVTGMADGFSYRVYYYVLMNDNTYTIHINNLEPLEKL